MTVQKQKRTPDILAKRIVWLAALLLSAGCTVYSLCVAEWMQALCCAVTMLLVSLPTLFEKLFRRLPTALFLCCTLYALGPMLGDTFLLYYTTSWWDKFLHFVGGVVFAEIAVLLLGMLNRKNTALTCAVFALCFSVAVSVLWEFCEYGMDTLAGTDAQHDAVVTSIHSYLLSADGDEVTSIENIQKTVIDGTEIDGYLDIGLHDTMTDMLYESLGALVFSGAFLCKHGGKKKDRGDTAEAESP